MDREDSNIVWVDPHVLGTPVITDTNGDGLENEMVLSLSYYFDNIYYGWVSSTFTLTIKVLINHNYYQTILLILLVSVSIANT